VSQPELEILPRPVPGSAAHPEAPDTAALDGAAPEEAHDASTFELADEGAAAADLELEDTLDLIDSPDPVFMAGLSPSRLPEAASLTLVAIGASAGGLNAIEELLDNIPPESGLSLVVVQHLPPDHKSLLADLLARHTRMPVVSADEGVKLRPNHVYLAPSRYNLEVRGLAFHLVERDPQASLNLPIDMFFRSVAYEFGPNAVAVVLSGTGSDGMRGVRAIKEANGLVIAQDEESARFFGMPRSAISTGCVDYVVPPREVGSRIVQYVAASGKDAPKIPIVPPGGDAYRRIIDAVNRRTSVDFTYYKPATIIRRVRHRMSVNHFTELDAYSDFVSESPQETLKLHRELLIGVTKFFRDPEAFASLQSKVIRRLVQTAGASDSLRVWVPGCSTGEEAYTLGMLFQDEVARQEKRVPIKIFATDIDREAVEFASNGNYLESIAADIPRDLLLRYFHRVGEGYQVTRQLRETVIFAVHNLVKDPPFARIDLVNCRNMLIYVEPNTQRKVFKSLHFALKPGGYMMLGSCETVGDLTDLFRPLDGKWRIYRSVGARRPVGQDELASPLRPGFVPQAGSRESASAKEGLTPIQLASQLMLTDYVPAGFLVNSRGELLNVFGKGNDYLRVPQGAASLVALKMVPRTISHLLATAIHKALRDEQEVVYRNVRTEAPDLPANITIRVRPLRLGENAEYALVLFEPALVANSSATSDAVQINEHAEERIAELQRELQYSKEHLHASIEELETSNEELQATNEELLASNEELQSMNEELESVNEELFTVNAEYQVKIQELSELNNDMDNLLRSTNIGTLFLDGKYIIRKFTPALREVMHVMDRDIGRPVSHLTLRFHDYGFSSDLERVLETREVVTRQVAGESGQHFVLRILPYVTDDGRADGIVVTFTNVTAAHHATEQLRMILDSLPHPVAVLDAEGTIRMANEPWRRWAREPSVFEAGEAAVGENLVTLCANATPTWRQLALPVSDALKRILRDGRGTVAANWSASSGDGHPGQPARQLFLTASSLLADPGGAVVCLMQTGPGEDWNR
jgi:two-component system CheB/CheR fusion protein